MKMHLIAASTALLLSAATGSVYAQSSTTAAPATPGAAGSSMLCSDFSALSADAQDAFLKGYKLGWSASTSDEMTGSITSNNMAGDASSTTSTTANGAATDNSANMASNDSSTSTGANANAGAMGNGMTTLPDAATLASNCTANPSDQISKYLGNSAVSTQ